MDKDTKRIIDHGEDMKTWLDTSQWKHVKALLDKKLDALSSIDTIDPSLIDPDKLHGEIRARQVIKELVKEWIADIEGEVEQYRTNLELYRKTKSDDIITIY